MTPYLLTIEFASALLFGCAISSIMLPVVFAQKEMRKIGLPNETRRVVIRQVMVRYLPYFNLMAAPAFALLIFSQLRLFTLNTLVVLLALGLAMVGPVIAALQLLIKNIRAGRAVGGAMGVERAMGAELADSFQVSDVYQDFGIGFLSVLVIWLAQIGLVVSYLLGILETPPDFTTVQANVFYFSGCLIQSMLATHSGMNMAQEFTMDWKSERPGHMIYSRLNEVDTRTIVPMMVTNGKTVVVTSRMVRVRQFMHLTANSVGGLILVGTLPLLLSTSSGYLEFVLNAAATLFVRDLDNLPTPRKAELVLHDRIDYRQDRSWLSSKYGVELKPAEVLELSV